MIPFQSEPRRADSRRHHSRDLAVVVSLMTAALPRVAELMTLPRRQARHQDVETWMCVRQRSCDLPAGNMLARPAPSAAGLRRGFFSRKPSRDEPVNGGDYYFARATVAEAVKFARRY